MFALNTWEQYCHQYFKKWGNEVKFDDENLGGLVISQGGRGGGGTLPSVGRGVANIQGGLVIRWGRETPLHPMLSLP